MESLSLAWRVISEDFMYFKAASWIFGAGFICACVVSVFFYFKKCVDWRLEELEPARKKALEIIRAAHKESEDMERAAKKAKSSIEFQYYEKKNKVDMWLKWRKEMNDKLVENKKLVDHVRDHAFKILGELKNKNPNYEYVKALCKYLLDPDRAEKVKKEQEKAVKIVEKRKRRRKSSNRPKRLSTHI